jgi:CubicO group peptidase (beta-lactamase class C family)
MLHGYRLICGRNFRRCPRFSLIDILGFFPGKAVCLLIGRLVTFQALILGLLLNQTTSALSQSHFPQGHWQQYATPEQVGWSSGQLAKARAYADSIGSAAVMIVYQGAVVAAWGDVTRKYECHSIRKSFMNALFGIYRQRGQIELSKTLAQLDIDDAVHPLTAGEKRATVRDLLTSRSGVFLPAAYEGNPEKPARGTHPPGTYWYYNNWDFNVLNTILEKEARVNVFEAFGRELANPLQMEDFELLDGYYTLEKNRSEHPAYLFRLSTRDMARFGLLYLAKGRWRDKQLLSRQWIEESTKAHSVRDGEGYGYLWWEDQAEFKPQGMYYASGYGGHNIFVFPQDELVIVHRVDTYTNQSVAKPFKTQLLKLILAARQPKPQARPALVPMPAQASPYPSSPGHAFCP